MKLSKQTKFFVAIGIQLLILVSIIILKLAIYSGGTEVVLRIRPVDPTDPFRGDYVTFTYDISTLSDYKIRPYNDEVVEGDTIYVELAKSDKYWKAVEFGKTKPADGAVFIRGVVTRVSSRGEFSDSEISIAYGAEEYFIPEGTGRNLDFRDDDISAKVALGENGDAVLKQLYINGKPWP